MRVAVFTDADFDRPDGVTTSLGALLRHAPPDVRPRIYSLADLEVDEPEYLALRSPALPLPTRRHAPLYVPRLAELARRLALDDMRAIHLTTTGPAGLAARWLAYHTGLPLVGSLHASAGPLVAPGTGGWGDRPRLREPYLRWLYRACSKVLAPSADVVRRLTGAGWPADRFIVWPGAVDAEAFSPARRSQRLRNTWHVSERRPAILCVAPLVRDGGIALIEPLGSLLHRQGIAHRFIVVGEGPALSGLQAACPDAVFAGRLSARDLATVMASSDLLLRPAEVSSTGLVELEAQASGLPVLVTSGGTARDHMRPGLTGLVCHPDDVLGFAARASELLTDAGRRRVMGEAARRFAQSRPWPSSLERVYALYRAAGRTAGPVGASAERGTPSRTVSPMRAGR
jgi:glycosyltransferase involved in cell wall biosynthesis